MTVRECIILHKISTSDSNWCHENFGTIIDKKSNNYNLSCSCSHSNTRSSNLPETSSLFIFPLISLNKVYSLTTIDMCDILWATGYIWVSLLDEPLLRLWNDNIEQTSSELHV